ncbi:MAG: ABC transporter permease [Deltaproteobacteria bacterium]|nr:ABC transporter permease [Deltaproteobacteria bacterium]MBW2122912.1 ABC transporter permease [Deltaproteobacteria bacterium]
MGTSREPTQYGWAFLLPSVILLGLVFFYPIVVFLSKTFLDPGPTLKNVIDLFRTDVYLKVLWITFRISFTVTVVCVLLGYPIAYLLCEVSEGTRNLLMIMVIIPFWTSLLVRTYAWMVLLGRRGVFNSILMSLGILHSPARLLHNSFAVNVGMIQMMTPFMVLAMYSVMKGIDRGLPRAAESLGANKFQAFIRVFLPLSLPGVGAGSLLVFIYSLGFFITPALLGGRKSIMISMVIEQQVSTLLRWGFASALALLLLAATLVFFLIYSRFFKIEQL